MSTRAEIRRKHNIKAIGNNQDDNEQLSPEDEQMYEEMILYISGRGREAKNQQ